MNETIVIGTDRRAKFAIPNDGVRHRVNRFWDKEPETVNWINTFTKDDVFYDVGANIGMYSIWAGLKCRTYAFEPLASNYELLNQNIALNNLSDRVTAYCLSVFNFEGPDLLHITSPEAGSSFSSFQEKVGEDLKPVQHSFVQGSYAATLVNLTMKLGKPTCLKIDVDGMEHKVFQGAWYGTLNIFDNCHSVMIELNEKLEEHNIVEKTLKNIGFEIKLKQGTGDSKTILFVRK